MARHVRLCVGHAAIGLICGCTVKMESTWSMTLADRLSETPRVGASPGSGGRILAVSWRERFCRPNRKRVGGSDGRAPEIGYAGRPGSVGIIMGCGKGTQRLRRSPPPPISRQDSDSGTGRQKSRGGRFALRAPLVLSMPDDAYSQQNAHNRSQAGALHESRKFRGVRPWPSPS
jgi:hypothetical protein